MKKDEQNDTKLKILDTARNLFAKNGYDAVSIRDIGRVVGIRESSIYYHFKNKQEIFDGLIDRMNQFMEGMKANFQNQITVIHKIEKEEFILTGWLYLEKFLLNTEIYEIISMLQIEKQRNETARNCYQKVMFEIPIEYQSRVFMEMKERGFLRTQEKEMVLAMEYQGMILSVYLRYFPCLPVEDENYRLAKEVLEQLLDGFYERYLRMED